MNGRTRSTPLVRRFACWLLGHRELVWDAYPMMTIDARRYTLCCYACRQGLEQVDITHTALVAAEDVREFTRAELWRRTKKHLGWWLFS